jgi:hypothetical protein
MSKALDSAIHLRDAVYALRLIVANTWEGRYSADTARDAIDWLFKKMEEECDALHDVLEDTELGQVRLWTNSVAAG